MLIVEMVFCALCAISIIVLWNVFVLNRPFKTKKYYELPILKIKGKVIRCKYPFWAARWSMHSYYIMVSDLQSKEYRSITAEITPNDKHDDTLAGVKRGDRGTLYYRQGKRANYFEDFVPDVEVAEEERIYFFDCLEELDPLCDSEDIKPKQKSVSRKKAKQIRRRQKKEKAKQIRRRQKKQREKNNRL